MGNSVIEFWLDLVIELEDLYINRKEKDSDNDLIFCHLLIMKNFLQLFYTKENGKILKECFNTMIKKYNVGQTQRLVESKILEIKNLFKKLEKKQEINEYYKKIYFLVVEEENQIAFKNYVRQKYDYLNAYNEEGITIFETIVDEYLKLDGEITKIIHYLKVIEYFLNQPNFHLEDDVYNRIKNKLNNNPSRKNKYLYKLLFDRENISLKELYTLFNKQDRFSSKSIIPIFSTNPFIRTNRVDLTSQEAITIDNETTKCMDDALFVEELDKTFRVYVHIIDVTPYVIENSSLDLEARQKGETLFFETSADPMLPFILSEDKTSLIEGEVRTAYTFIVDFDKETFQIIPHNGNYINFCSSLVRVKHHLTYSQVNAFLIDRCPITSLDKILKTLAQIAQYLNLNNNRDENYMRLNNYVGTKIKRSIKNEKFIETAEKIVSEFMILTGHLVASYCLASDIPYIYRVHKQSLEEEEISELNNLLNKIDRNKLTKTDRILFNELKNKTLNARYSVDNYGHFGLGLASYSHSTSPARRYIDLNNLRSLFKILEGSDISFQKEREKMRILVDHINNLKQVNDYFCSQCNWLITSNLSKKKKKG